MPLSLVSRKNLKDNEASLTSNLAAIEKSLGTALTVEFDFEDIITKCNDSWVTNSCGSIFYKDVLGNLAKNMDKVGKDEMIKEAFLAAVPSKKVVFVAADEKLPSYWVYSFENGELRVSFRPKICNTNDVNTFKLETIIPVPGTYTLMTKLNFKVNEQKMKDNLAAVKTALKSTADWSLDEASVESIYPKVAADLKNSFGHIVTGLVEKVSVNLKKRCGDEMILEAVQEATTAHQIVLHNDEKADNWSWSFKDGKIFINYKSMTNTNDVEKFDFIKLL